ncbi:hypothetical protein GTO91_06100 [Heliobacterium undosum]|uniref:Uncharacterized protein n=2 Tax=Heliomicrobium undosum TaxID=121734 RepID=A0A845L698_9FIRM|nr:hypothetical protein [Heliomicrobium undosum]
MPSYPSPGYAPGYTGAQLRAQTLSAIEPVVQYGLREAQVTSVPHAMREATAITLLMGRGYDSRTARQIVESWEIDERLPRARSEE